MSLRISCWLIRCARVRNGLNFHGLKFLMSGIGFLPGFWGLVAFCMGWTLTACASAASAPPIVVRSVDGTDYATLESVALNYQLKMAWKPGADTLLLSNRWVQARFFINARRCELDGVCVYLSHEVIRSNNTPMLAYRDLATVLRPLLFPAKRKPPKQIRVVAIDPGHGGRDPGNQNGLQKEKDYTLKLARELRDRLQHCGLKVVMIRDDDRFVQLEDRPYKAKIHSADVLLSLHFNSVSRSNSQLRGSEVFCLAPEGAQSTDGNSEGIPTIRYSGNKQDSQNILLAYHVHKALIRNLNMEDLGVRRARWVVLRNAEMPAILIEGGFMSDPQDARRIYSDQQRKQLAQAILDGFLAYKRLMER